MNRKQVQKEMDAAHAAAAEFRRTHFNLGSAFTECERLKSYAGPALLAALASGDVGIDMPSEYHAPFFVFKEISLAEQS